MNQEPEVLIATDKQNVDYCISLTRRDLQVAHNTQHVKGRIEPHYGLRIDPIAVVCFGPSLNDTWEKIKEFKYVITCSGAHRFLLKHGIVPTWHCLPSYALVDTEVGQRTIKWIVDTEYKGNVKSLKLDGTFNWSPVVKHHKAPNSTNKRWVKVRTQTRRNVLSCTADHRVMVVRDILDPKLCFIEAERSNGTYSVGTARKGQSNALFNKQQLSVLLGIMLGDGSIHKSDSSFYTSHCDAQRDYIQKIHSILGGVLSEVTYNTFGSSHPFHVLHCGTNGQTRALRKLLYINGKKSPVRVLDYLDEISLAFWYMDDGNLMKEVGRSSRSRLFTIGFSEDDQLVLVNWFEKRWNIDASIVRETYENGDPKIYLRFGVKGSNTLFSLISKFVPESMEYKLPPAHRGGIKHLWDAKCLEYSAEMVSDVITIDPKSSRGKSWLYDIEVEDHNFVANDSVVHNCDVDPREHKIELLGEPHKDVEYLMASAVHPKMFEHLAGYNVKLWHVFANDEEAKRVLPPGEWALFGGSSAGLRALTIARFLGFTDLHVFGMDGSFGVSGKHAAKHPNQPKKHQITEYNGVRYETTASVLECARQTFNELNQMPDVKATFYGDGLVQAMAKDYKPQPVPKGTPTVGIVKPELISRDYRDLNAQLHKDNVLYGAGGGRHADTVRKLIESTKAKSVCDYGCGKGQLAKALEMPIWEYDPAIPGKDALPRPADLVCCTDVLEHVEPERLNFVLDDLRRCVKQVGYFVVHTGPSSKTLADGRNAHLIQKDDKWWTKQLEKFFTVAKVELVKQKLHIIVGPKIAEVQPNDAMTITEIKNGAITCKFHTPNDTTKWRAKSLLTKEPVTAKWVNSMKSGEILFDVGANVGGYTVLAGTQGVKVYAFEPEADNYALLVKNMALNGIEPNAYCMALTDHIEFGMLRLSQRGGGGSCHSFGAARGIGIDNLPDRSQGSVGMRLDDLVAWGMPSPDHVKIDVDGFEHKVIAGARGVLSNGVKSLLVEVNTNNKDHLEMVGQLEAMGFEYDKAQVEGSIRKEGSFKGVSEYLFTKRIRVESNQQFVSRFLDAKVETEPFKWVYVQDVFSNYTELVDSLPDNYTEISKSRGTKGYPQRFTAGPVKAVWVKLFQDLREGQFKQTLCRLFGVPNEGLDDECLLIRDHAGYSIGPHTDSPKKVITVLFYLPKDESLVGAGTSIYTPKEAGFTCKGGPHYPSDQFNLVKTMPFKPNSAFAFLKTDNSFHGVEPCTGTRDVLLYDIRRK